MEPGHTEKSDTFLCLAAAGHYTISAPLSYILQERDEEAASGLATKEVNLDGEDGLVRKFFLETTRQQHQTAGDYLQNPTDSSAKIEETFKGGNPLMPNSDGTARHATNTLDVSTRADFTVSPSQKELPSIRALIGK